MAIMLCPWFVPISLSLLNINRSFPFQGPVRNTELYTGVSLMLCFGILCFGILTWYIWKRKRPCGFLRSLAPASTRPYPWDLWRLVCPLLIPSYPDSPKTSFLLRVVWGRAVSWDCKFNYKSLKPDSNYL